MTLQYGDMDYMITELPNGEIEYRSHLKGPRWKDCEGALFDICASSGVAFRIERTSKGFLTQRVYFTIKGTPAQLKVWISLAENLIR